jgi:hypothetical protein
MKRQTIHIEFDWINIMELLTKGSTYVIENQNYHLDVSIDVMFTASPKCHELTELWNNREKLRSLWENHQGD